MYNTIVLQGYIPSVISSLESLYDSLEESGNLFCLVSSEYDIMGNVTYDFLDVAKAADKKGYKYINTIICVNPEGKDINFNDNVFYLVWFAKDLSKQFFTKDPIRESHIWEKVEWGKRAKNYNPKGKDPGNVWIPTEDDGAAHITKHILLSVEDIILRILATTLSGKGDSAFLLCENRQLYQNVSDPRLTKQLISNSSTPITSLNCVKSLEESRTGIKSRLIFGSSEDMSAVTGGSVDAVITSPPYWDLKDYFKKGQIGQEPYEEYLRRMNAVWQNCYRVLKKTGTLWININIRRQKKELVLIPWDFVRQCKSLGFYYKGIVIWHKSSGIPTGDKNLVDRHEYVLVFSKSAQMHIDKKRMASFSDYKNEVMNGGALWNINRKAGSVGKHFIHPAIYPNELVQRIVQVTTLPNQVILDPFLGSGTSLIAAEKEGRRCIGYEFNEGFKELINSRIRAELSKDPFSDTIYEPTLFD